MIEDIESKILSLGGEEAEGDVDTIVIEDEGAVLPEEVTLSEEDNFDGLLGVKEERERPSSMNSKIDDESEKEPHRDDL